MAYGPDRDAGNMRTYGSDFILPDFRDWRLCVREMVATLHIALVGDRTGGRCCIPYGTAVFFQHRSPGVYQPVRRLMVWRGI